MPIAAYAKQPVIHLIRTNVQIVAAARRPHHAITSRYTHKHIFIMLTLQQMLLDYPVTLLRALASVRSVSLSSVTQLEMVEELAVALADPAGIVEAVETCAPDVQHVLQQLVTAGGRMTAPTFFRLAGEVRQGGPNWLARAQPWLAAETPAEVLWYRGLIGRTFADVSGDLAEFVFVPLDVLPWLPMADHGQPPLDLSTAPSPITAHQAGRTLAVDMVSLLGLVANEAVPADGSGQWSRSALRSLNQQLLMPETESQLAQAGRGDSGDRLSFLISLAESLAWLHYDGGRARLDAPAVRAWLEATGAQQLQQLWQGWLASTRWNDLLRTPALRCEGSSWHNDPVATRRRFTQHLAAIPPGVWYNSADLIRALHDHDPDFQRADGVYTTWYIRRSDESNYLLGFEHWADVEGALIAYFLTGPLYWLGTVDLGDPAGDAAAHSWRLTDTGAAWMRHLPAPPAPPGPGIRVAGDFRIFLPHATAAMDRFRVARFAAWEQSQPEFCYRITQTTLRRAAETGVTAARILDFLHQATHHQLPENVVRALERR